LFIYTAKNTRKLARAFLAQEEGEEEEIAKGTLCSLLEIIAHNRNLLAKLSGHIQKKSGNLKWQSN